MGVLKFGFTERLLFDNKNEMGNFLEGVEIDLSLPPKFDYPTLKQVKMAISNTPFTCQQMGYFEESGKRKWGCLLSNKEGAFTPVYIEDVTKNSNQIKEFYFQKGDDEIIIIFLQKMAEFCGSILFYCDTGAMSLIQPNKPLEQIKKELGYFQ